MKFCIIALLAIQSVFSKSLMIHNDFETGFLDQEMSQDLIQMLQMLQMLLQMSPMGLTQPDGEILSRTPRHRRYRKSTNNLPKKLCNPKLCNKCDKLLTQIVTNEFTGFCVRLMRINNCCDHHRSTMDRLF